MKSAISRNEKLRQRVRGFLRRQSKPWLVAEAAALVLFVGFLDYITGYEAAVSPFYSVPILLSLWLAGLDAAIFISLLSAIVGWFVDRATGHVYSNDWLPLWNSAVRLIFFYLVVLEGINVRRQRDESQARIDLLERTRKLERAIITSGKMSSGGSDMTSMTASGST